MSNTFDIQVTFDAETILQKYGTNTDPNNPVQVDASYVYMVVAAPAALSGNGGGELRLVAQTDDTIRWRESTPGVDLQTILYAFSPLNNGIISNPQLFLSNVTVPVPNPNNPLEPTTQTIQDYFWNSLAQAPGQVTYHFNFMIVDRHGNTQGYYAWDPFITITS
jgi:hypothetical protein